MFTPKRLSKEGVAAALAKAERYRLLNEPWEAESICRDVLDVDPENQGAVVTLLLSLTDQFEEEPGADLAGTRALLPRLADAYKREYYAGIICERWAKRFFRRDVPGMGPVIYDWLRQAMVHYEEAERLRPPGEDDAILRWNTCARLILRHPHLRPGEARSAPAIELE